MTVSSMKTNESITYYITISYLNINSSTFYPPTKAYAIGEYDLNNSDDIERYKNYVQCWNEDTGNYHPITLYMKLIENINGNSPYFYESNEVKMKFNIIRSDILTSWNYIPGVF